MNTEIKNAIQAADSEAQYDESAKRLLAQKYVLAHILVRTVEEFQGMEIEKVVSLIEGDPYISKVPVASGLTNKDRNVEGKRIVGLNTEAGEKNEGLVRFDIIFYVSRLISSQKERDFVKSNYNDIKTVYSIWVCMNMPENSMCHIYLTKEDLLGKHNWKGNLNLVNIVMIGLTNALPQRHNEYVLHRLLCAMFSNELSQQQKMKIMEQEYHIPMEESFKEEVSIMCNLSQGIKEAGIAEGREAGIAEGREAGIAEGKQREIEKVILNMHKKGYSLEQIMDATDLEAAELETIIEKLK